LFAVTTDVPRESCALGAADQFDENVDVGGAGKLRCVGEVDCVAEIDSPVALAAGAIGDQREIAPRPRRHGGGLPQKKPNQARADHPETGDAQAKRVRHLLLAPPRGDLDSRRPVPGRDWKSRAKGRLQP
jgi:hypothetical protein